MRYHGVVSDPPTRQSSLLLHCLHLHLVSHPQREQPDMQSWIGLPAGQCALCACDSGYLYCCALYQPCKNARMAAQTERLKHKGCTSSPSHCMHSRVLRLLAENQELSCLRCLLLPLRPPARML